MYRYLLQREGFEKNEHNQHAHKQFVLVVRSANVFGLRIRYVFAVRNVRVPVFFDSYRKQSDRRSPISHGTNSVVTHNADTNTGSQAGTSGAESSGQMGQATKGAVGISRSFDGVVIDCPMMTPTMRP